MHAKSARSRGPRKRFYPLPPAPPPPAAELSTPAPERPELSTDSRPRPHAGVRCRTLEPWSRSTVSDVAHGARLPWSRWVLCLSSRCSRGRPRPPGGRPARVCSWRRPGWGCLTVDPVGKGHRHGRVSHHRRPRAGGWPSAREPSCCRRPSHRRRSARPRLGPFRPSRGPQRWWRPRPNGHRPLGRWCLSRPRPSQPKSRGPWRSRRPRPSHPKPRGPLRSRQARPSQPKSRGPLRARQARPSQPKSRGPWRSRQRRPSCPKSPGPLRARQAWPSQPKSRGT
ncbi:hypothetical protein SAMN05421837_108157 [Amycolatopsis pretoriensis]|uniref:Uncharacterized protein n=1 Tax=Amycolatopsis pretoriensis TaxID=218821 RepID=A0A1H5RB05_9PSEU|nr:hypothetical protein SAMN05421837_108157 [Amycolatopsis pretoriensis]